ncbi:Thioredoxin reductase [Collimonas sp. OK607]|nr:Thioredoxin reductase [Collimonas sp. OK607]
MVAAGAGCFTPRKLAVDGATAYEGTSLLYSVKNIEQFLGKRLLILGGGDSALDWTIALEQVASRVTMVHRRDVFRATPESVEQVHQLARAGRIDLHFGSICALKGDAPNLSGAVLSGSDGSTTGLDCDIILVFFGLTNKLGPISEWHIGAAEDEIPVDPITMQTRKAGIYAVGDIAQYPGKLKLIVSGFSEAALMGRAVYEYLRGEKPRFQYSTHSHAMQSSEPIPHAAYIEAEPLQAMPSTMALQTDPTKVTYVLVTDLAGNEHSLPAKPGRTLLEIMDAAKVPVKGSCFGACNCSTCHVYVDEAWFNKLDPMIDQEQEALDQVSTPKPFSRLACQIEFRQELSGMKVKLTVDTIPD